MTYLPSGGHVERTFRNLNILVTGATGFVGAHVTEALVARGAKVTALIHEFQVDSFFHQRGLIEAIRPVVGSLTDFPLLDRVLGEHRIDTVVHMGAIATEGLAFQNPLSAFEVNVRGTYQLLEACRQHRDSVKRVVVASSDKAYGTATTLPYREDLPLVGRHPYDVSKSCADLIAQAYFHSFGLPVVIGRYGNIFGPGDLSFNRLIPGTLRRIYRGESPLVKLHARGSFTRDFLFIEDVVESYLALLRSLDTPENHGEAFNFALSLSRPVEEIVKTIQKITATEHLPIETMDAPHGEIPHQHVCNRKALQRLDWKPRYGLEESLKITSRWYFQFFQKHEEPHPNLWPSLRRLASERA